MAEPSTSTALATVLSAAKLWSVIASFAGSIVPILAVSDRTKISWKNTIISAIVGTSFAVFVGPILCDYLNLKTPEAISALSWIMGGTGVHLIRAIILWIDDRGSLALDRLVNKGISWIPGENEDHVEVTVNVNQDGEEHKSKADHYKN
jgi:hypothetical protein